MFLRSFVLIPFVCMVTEAHQNTDVFNEGPQRNLTQQIWHSYEFDTGIGNREELYIVKVAQFKNFVSTNGVFKWKTLQAQGEILALGLGKNFLLVTTYNNRNGTILHKEEIDGVPKTFDVFQQWDYKSQTVQHFVVVAISKENKDVLKWFVVENRQLKFLSIWPYHRIINQMNAVKVNHQLKLLIVSHHNSNNQNFTLDIYNLNATPQIDLWLFEEIHMLDLPSSVVLFNENDNTFIAIAHPQSEVIHVWIYSKQLCQQTLDQKHFKLHQKIITAGLKSLISFQVGFSWHIAVASTNSSIYGMGENLQFQLNNHFNFGDKNQWMAISIDTYREDVMLLSSSESEISALIWNGLENFQIINNFVDIVCNDDLDCINDMKKVSLIDTAEFQIHDHKNIIMATETGVPFLVELVVKLRPLPDDLSVKINEVIKLKNTLKVTYIGQIVEIENLLAINDNAVGGSSASISGIKKEGVQSSSDLTNKNENLEPLSHTKNWSDTLIALDILRTRINNLKNDINDIGRENFNFSENYETVQDSVLNVSNGIVFHGEVTINKLYLSSINGHNMQDLLKNSYRKDMREKIRGTKILKNLNAKSLAFNKINQILNCNLVFSDDPWEAVNGNIITGNILWEGNIHILNDLQLHNGDKQSNALSTKNYQTLSNISKHIFNELQFEELEITNEANIQSTINLRSMILPIHMAPLDTHYLETVNQARVELVNVKGNLNVDTINGKHFREILEQMHKLDMTSNKNDFTKIKGALMVQSLNATKINSVPLEFNENLEGENVHTYRNRKQYSRNFVNFNRRRNIYVFQDLDVTGIIRTNMLNDLNWIVLNDTIRKDEETVVRGKKTFRKTLSGSGVNLLEGINDEYFTRVVMTTTSDQSVKFPQTFKKAEFKSLTLKGKWDEIDFKKLNRTIVRPQLKVDHCKTNLTILNSFTLSSESFVVTDFINYVSLPSLETHNRKDLTITAGKGLNLIKASKVLVSGSVNSSYMMNDVNLKNMERIRVSLSQSQVIEQDMSQRNLTLNGDVTLISLNDNDVSSLVDSDGDINVIDNFLEGQLRGLKKLIVKGNIKTTNGINGYNLSNLLDNGIFTAQPFRVPGTVVFEDVGHFNYLNVTNSINNCSLKELEEDIAVKHSHVFVNGIKKFTTLRVVKDMKAKFLNDHLVQEVSSLQGDQVMKGSLTIHGDVVIKGNVTTNGGFNEINVSKLAKKFSIEHNSYIFGNDLNLNHHHIKIRNLMVGDTIQNVSFDDVMRNVVYKEGNYNIVGKKLFQGEVKFKGNLSIEKVMNDVSVKELSEDIALVNQECKIKGTVTISEAILNLLHVDNYFNSSLINNFDMNHWFEDGIPLNSWEVVNDKMIFVDAEVAENIEVDLINDHMSSAIIPLKGKQFIPVLGLFQRLNTTSDVSVGGYVNGQNLFQELQKSILLTNNQTINNRMTFHEDFIVNGNLLVDYVKGKSIKQLVTLDTEQVIENGFNFYGSMTIRGNLDHLKAMNNINLRSWYSKSVFLNREQEISGLWSVRGNIAAKNVSGKVSFNKIHLMDVSKDISKTKTMIIQKKDEAEMDYYSHCNELRTVSQELTKLPYIFHQFEVLHIIDTQSVIESVIPLQISGSDYLIITFLRECFSAIYQWDEDNSIFIYLRHINIGPVTKWLVAYRNNVTYLITSYGYGTVQCDENRLPGNVWIFEDNSEKYVHLLMGNAFADLIHENNTSDTFFTLEENGAIYRWTIKDDKSVEDEFWVDIGQGNYRFLEFNVMGGLAVSNGREIKEIKLKDKSVLLDTFVIPYGNVFALPLNGKILVGLVLRDKILIYEDFRAEKLFSVIQTYKAGSVLWFNYGSNKQAFLIVSSHHRLIEIYEYKSVSGLVKRMSLQLVSSKLQEVSLPLKRKHKPVKFVMVIQKSKVIFLEADMLGEFYEENDSIC